ncbi:MAG: TonB-dependent receptor plug domain-containing protein [Polaribacter sp.]|uniref:TonB-dependent receptor plug domain-containing protein n=1 Tax=Polaribacter sp. TaxID=1920175 RepID=UPI0032674E05
MFLNKLISILLMLFAFSVFCQEKKKDSTKVTELDEIIVTGQLRPQSIKKSVFEVKVITRKDIERRAGNNLADLLSQMLNIDIFQNSSSGKSDINVLGLDGKYFKVLIDNISVVNEEGFGKNTDLTLINLDDVERVEFVQGAMGVQYGANTLSGVLNVITKKKSNNSWEIKTFLQEETIGKEYELFNQGRHIQSISIGRQLTKDNYIRLSYNRNDFRGFLGELKGEYYDDEKDNLRGYNWLPKKQNFAKLLLSHQGEHFSAFYKFDYLHENISSYDSIVRSNLIPATQTSNPSSLDEKFNNQRFVHHLNITGDLGKVPYNISASYQKQEKKRESYTYFIREDLKENKEEKLFLSKEVWFSRGTFNNLINSNNFTLQAGYEFTNEFGFGSADAVTIVTGEEEVSNSLRSTDLFASSEIDFNKNFSIKPGVRVSFTNLFNIQFYYSTSARHLFKNNWEARVVLGFGTRTPNYDELYTYFVDVNHDLRGNENLNPEEGVSTFFHLKKHTQFNKDFSMKNKVTFSYINVTDRIELVVINETPLQLQYNNIDKFSSMGISLENDFYYKNMQLNFGASYYGINRIFDYDTGDISNRQANFQLNSNVSYVIPGINTSLTAYYKYIGITNRFIQVDGSFQNQEINPYSWLDVIMSKKFFNKKIEATFGVRNLFDVVDGNTNSTSGSAHTGASSTVNLGYGRSYVLRLAYNINI